MASDPAGYLFWWEDGFEPVVTYANNLSAFVPLYERCSHDILGHVEKNDDGQNCEEEDPDVARCYNCGSTRHMLVQCPIRHNPKLIRLTREMHDFFKGGPVSPFRRIHEVAEWKKQRIQWLKMFQPGRIVGGELREALDLRDGDAGEYVPWLPKMAEYGYPKGWIAKRDPRIEVWKRIAEQNIVDEDERWFLISGESEELLLLPSGRSSQQEKLHDNDSSIRDSCSSADGSGQVTYMQPLRWAHYPETYFSNSLLFAYAPPTPAPEVDPYDVLIEWYDGILGYTVAPQPSAPPPPLPPSPPKSPPPPLPLDPAPLSPSSPSSFDTLQPPSPESFLIPSSPSLIASQAPLLLPSKPSSQFSADSRSTFDNGDQECDMELSDSDN
jgi:zinc finger CCHC domain-containing protein 8